MYTVTMHGICRRTINGDNRLWLQTVTMAGGYGR